MLKVEEKERRDSFVSMIFWVGMWLVLLHFVVGCTVKIDNPFYAPSTLDVNKNESKGAANYLKDTKPGN